jgi:hypothetical protein
VVTPRLSGFNNEDVAIQETENDEENDDEYQAAA